MSFNYSDKKVPKIGEKPNAAPKQKSSPKPPDGKDLLEAVGKVQQKRDGLRRKKKKPGIAMPPQAEKQPGDDHDEDDM